jgi:uncharacterized protein (TIGR00297 family)
MPFSYLFFVLILFIVLFISVKKNRLTFAAAITAAVVGLLVFMGTGFTGIAMLGLFFLLGMLASSFKINVKEKLGATEINKGGRTTGQVIANGGVAAIMGLLAWHYPNQLLLFQMMMAGALASATADTLSSELGTVYGKQFYNILSFKIDRRGENGVISLEGTFIGIIGSALIAMIQAFASGWNDQFWWIVIAGTIGNLTDSILGATLERRRLIGNDTVNFINTLVGAFTVYLLMKL